MMYDLWTVFPIQAAMRRAGQNPTDVEIVSLINKYDNDTGYIDFKVSLCLGDCQNSKEV